MPPEGPGSHPYIAAPLQVRAVLNLSFSVTHRLALRLLSDSRQKVALACMLFRLLRPESHFGVQTPP